MKSDLTCPVEITKVTVSREKEDTKEHEQIVCLIEFFNLSEKVIDSLQMNIICFVINSEAFSSFFSFLAAKAEICKASNKYHRSNADTKHRCRRSSSTQKLRRRKVMYCRHTGKRSQCEC